MPQSHQNFVVVENIGVLRFRFGSYVLTHRRALCTAYMQRLLLYPKAFLSLPSGHFRNLLGKRPVASCYFVVWYTLPKRTKVDLTISGWLVTVEM